MQRYLNDPKWKSNQRKCCFLSLMPVLGYFGLIFMGLSYGGLPTMSSAFTRKTFGSKNYPVNLPIVNLNLLIASFIGPTVAARMFDTAGSYLGPMLCVIAFAIVALICAVLLRKKA